MNIKKCFQSIQYFLESNFVGINRLFVLVYSNQDGSSKEFKALRNYLPNVNIKNYNVITSGKNYYDLPIDSEINKEIRKLTMGQGGLCRSMFVRL